MEFRRDEEPEYYGGHEETGFRDDSDTEVIFGCDTDLVFDRDTGPMFGTTDAATDDDATDDDSTDEDATDDHSTDEETTDDDAIDAEEWDEDDMQFMPYLGRYYPLQYPPPVQPLCRAGANFTIEEAERIVVSVRERNIELAEEYIEMVNDNITPLPVRPLQILPNVTDACISGHECYHREYWTDSAETTEPTHPFFRPCTMMQVYSLRLSRTFDYPVNIYGTFAIRDCWEPLCNYVFNRTRDDPATIMPGCSSLPLCGPCRGIYALQYVLIDVNLWIKEEGEMSAYKPLFCGYLEFDAGLTGSTSKVYGRVLGDCYGLDMCYGFLNDAIETSIEVIADAKHPSDVRMSTFTCGFDDEVVLYDGTFCETKVISHFVAVRKQEELHVVLQLRGSEYRWTFKAGVGVLVAPEGPISDFAQLVVKVDFRTQGRAASAWEWSSISLGRIQQQSGSTQLPAISVDMEDRGVVVEEEKIN